MKMSLEMRVMQTETLWDNIYLMLFEAKEAGMSQASGSEQTTGGRHTLDKEARLN